MTPKYALELALLDGGVGIYPVQIFWHPQEPTAAELLDLTGPLSAEMAHLMSMALRHDEIGGRGMTAIDTAVAKAGGRRAFAHSLCPPVTVQAVSLWAQRGWVPPARALEIEGLFGVDRALSG